MINFIMQQQNLDLVINGILYGLIIAVFIILLIKVNFFNT